MHRTGRLFLLIVLALVVAVPVAAQDSSTVNIGQSDMLGHYLTNAEGMTLYTFDHDSINTSNCYDECAENWPPLTVDSADAVSAAEGISGVLGTTERTDGTLQVTYNGWPLYSWVYDSTPGDTTGQGVGRVWWVVSPGTISIGGNDDLGRFLVGPEGRTLYMFTNDQPGVSNCTGDCAMNWPALTVDSADAATKGVNLPGELSTITRDDGTMQVTYNGWPLYYWKDDAAIGDATGQGRGDVWFVVRPETVTVGGNEALGDFLTAADGMTLYVFANDEPGVSNCTDQCLENWPALTVSNADALTASPDMTGMLGTIDRGDGTLQVTYNDMPLYFYKQDLQPGDTLGQGIGGVWSVAAP